MSGAGSASVRAEVRRLIERKYGAAPERLWLRFPEYEVFRHADNRKWFALIMDIPAKKLGIAEDRTVDVLNLKLPDGMLDRHKDVF